jgi:hypothetical protein
LLLGHPGAQRSFPGSGARKLTHNEAIEEEIRWSNDSLHVLFQVDNGSVEGKYRDTQTRLYWVDADNGEVERWAADFTGQIAHYAVASDGSVLAAARLGTEVQVYSEAHPGAVFSGQAGLPGTYEWVDTAAHSGRVAFVHSDLSKPAEVYLAEDISKLQAAIRSPRSTSCSPNAFASGQTIPLEGRGWHHGGRYADLVRTPDTRSRRIRGTGRLKCGKN